MKTHNHFQKQLRSADEIEEIVIWTRYHLYNNAIPCGAHAIRSTLEKEGINPLPSLSTIGRILHRNGLTYRRTGIYA